MVDVVLGNKKMKYLEKFMIIIKFINYLLMKYLEIYDNYKIYKLFE